MSPEQADTSNIDVDTRTDIYSLGVVLYVLVTGTAPFAVGTCDSFDLSSILKAIRDEEPTLPSQRLMAATDLNQLSELRRADPRRLLAQVRGDLDWIILKCLEKERGRRYDSAVELAHDLERFLHGDLVQARPASFLYRLRRQVHRNRAAILIGCAFVGVLVMATVVSIRQAIIARKAEVSAKEGWVQAESQRRNAQNINDFMREVLGNAKAGQKGASFLLVDALAVASVKAAERFSDNPLQESAIHSMLGEICSDLTLLADAVRETKQAVDVLQKVLPKEDPKVIAAELKYVQALMNQGNFGEAELAIEGLLSKTLRVLGPEDAMAFEAERLSLAMLKRERRFLESIDGLRKLHERAIEARINDATLISILQSLISALRTQLGVGDKQNELAVVCEIEALAEEMVLRSTNRYGPNATPTLKGQVTAAEMSVHCGEFEKAKVACEQLLLRHANQLGESHHVCLAAMQVLALAKHRLGFSEEAADLELKVVQHERSTNDNPITLLSKIGDALPYLDSGGRWTEGETLAKEYAEMLSMYSGHENMTFGGRAYVARFASLQGRTEEAEAWFQKLVQDIQGASGPDGALARVHLFYAAHLRKKHESKRRKSI